MFRYFAVSSLTFLFLSTISLADESFSGNVTSTPVTIDVKNKEGEIVSYTISNAIRFLYIDEDRKSITLTEEEDSSKCSSNLGRLVHAVTFKGKDERNVGKSIKFSASTEKNIVTVFGNCKGEEDYENELTELHIQAEMSKSVKVRNVKK